MKLVSWNIYAGGYDDYEVHEGKPEKLDLIVKAIKEIGADFVSLVDVNGWHRVFTDEDLKQIFGYKNVFQIKIMEACEIGLTVMTNFEVKEFKKLWIGDRYCVRTSVLVDGKEIDVFPTYLDNRSEKDRIMQIKATLSNVEDVPTVICGDLNTIKKNELEWWIKTGVNIFGLLPMWRRDAKVVNNMNTGRIVQILEDGGFRDGDDKKKKTIPSRFTIKGIFGPFLRLDYIFIKLLKVKKFEVIRSRLFDRISDHYPITAEIE